MRRTRENAEKTKLQLLEAAVSLFAAKGVTATTLNEIAEQAGVTRGALYWHFQDKEDIIRSIWQTYAVPRLDPMLVQLGELDEKAPVAAFRDVVGGMMRCLVQDGEMALAIRILLHNVELIDCHISLRHFFMDVRTRFIKGFGHAFEVMQRQGLLRPDVAPLFAAQGFMAFLEGLLDEHMLESSDVNLGDMGVSFMDIYLRGVLRAV